MFQFLCTDPEDGLNVADSISPRRTIETSKSVSPEGTLITTTTTTTQKPHNTKLDANIDSKTSSLCFIVLFYFRITIVFQIKKSGY